MTNLFKFEHNPHYTFANQHAIPALRITHHVLYISDNLHVSVTKTKHSTVLGEAVVYCDNHTKQFTQYTRTTQPMYIIQPEIQPMYIIQPELQPMYIIQPEIQPMNIIQPEIQPMYII